MVFHDDPLFHIYFGDAADAMNPAQYLSWHEMSSLLVQPQIKPIVQRLQLHKLFFLHQVHTSNGYAVTKETTLRPFAYEGDYLVTNQASIGLGVVAADCLPVVCIDTQQRIIGIAHAGWRGALAGVVCHMLSAMQKNWQTQARHCKLFFGPSAQRCCYQVGEEFYQYLAPFWWRHEVLHKEVNGYFFDLPLFVRYQMREVGIADNAMCITYAQCTICNPQFYSSRRSQGERQMTVVALKMADC